MLYNELVNSNNRLIKRCLSGGIGRRTGLKILRDSTLVSVQVRPQAPSFWRNTQVWLKGPVLKTGRSCKRRRGSNPFSSAIKIYKFIAGWSSLVARWAHNPKVVGSNPSPATMVPWCSGYHVCLSRRRSRVQVPSEPPLFFGFIAQSVEQRTENPRVAGSIPAGATMNKNQT